MDLVYLDEKGEKKKVFMGSYGIGLGRLMGVVVELLSDEKGIVWPETIAPYKAHIVNISTDSDDAIKMSEDLYSKLTKAGVDVIYDDRELRAGEKFNDADLIGVPWRIVVSDKLAKDGVVEIKKRDSEKKENIKVAEIIERFTK
jgi:prolyl-tRNA synthetase